MGNNARLAAYRRRRRVLGAMAQETKKIAERVASRMQQWNRETLVLHHYLGQIAVMVTGREAIYGSDAVEALAMALGTDADFLHRLGYYARKFTRHCVEQSAVRRMADGGWITLSHFLILSMITSESQRLEFLERVFTEPLSAKQLAREVGSNAATTTILNPRGKPPCPRTPLGAVSEFFRTVRSINDREEQWSKVLFDGVDQLTSVQEDDVLLPKLRNAQLETQKLIKLSADFLPRFSHAIQHVESLLQAKS